MKLSKNFSLSEFDCNDGSVTPDNIIVNLQLLAEQLQVLRDFSGTKQQEDSSKQLILFEL